MGQMRADRHWIPVILLLFGALTMTLVLIYPDWFSNERGSRHLESAAGLAHEPSRNETPAPDAAAADAAAQAEQPSAEVPPYGDHALPKAESIRGRVLDREGNAVPDAVVTAAYKETRTRPYAIVAASQVRSEQDGFFVLGPLERRNYYVVAVEPKRGIGLRAGLMPGAWVEIVLAPGASVRGVVTARASGEPVAGATVVAKAANFHHETATDAEGKYVLAPLPATADAWAGQSVLVVGAGFKRAERNNLLLRPGAEHTVDFALETGAELTGKVVDARTLQPVAGAVVGEGWEPWDRTVATGDDGAYRLPHVDTSPNQVFTARADGFLPQERQSDGTGKIEFALDASLVLEGKVRDPKEHPVKGARVYLHRIAHAPGFEPASRNRRQDFTTSGEGGVFRFENVLPGKVAVIAFGSVHAPGEYGPIELPPGGAPPPGILVTLRHGVTVEGEVRDLKDQPIPDVRVQLQRFWGQVQGYQWARNYIWSEQPSWYSDENGRFVLTGAVAGKLWLTAWDRTYGWASTQIEGAEGQQITDVVISFAGATISGTFVTADGEPIPGAHVQARGPKNMPRPGWRWTQTDSLGRFRLGGLKDGVYDITANSTFGNPEQLKDIPAGSEGIELKLEVNHVLRGVVTSALSGRALERFTLSIQPKRLVQAESSRLGGGNFGPMGSGRGTRWQGELRTPDGRFERPVTPGTYALTVKAPGHAPQVLEEVIVERHAPPQPVYVALDGGGGIKGKAIDAEGKPLRNSRINARVYRAPGEAQQPSDWMLGGSDRTDSQGRYFIEGLAPGTYLIQLSLGRRGSVTEQVNVTGREMVQADLRLLPTGTITIKATDEEGNPVPGVMFYFRDEKTNNFVGWAHMTNADGVSTSQPMRMGTCVVQPMHRKRPGQEDTYVGDNFTVDVPAGGNLVVEVTLRKKPRDEGN